jgi:hypothetical protein
LSTSVALWSPRKSAQPREGDTSHPIVSSVKDAHDKVCPLLSWYLSNVSAEGGMALYGKAVASMITIIGGFVALTLSPFSDATGTQRSLVIGGSLLILLIIVSFYWMRMGFVLFRFLLALIGVVCIAVGLA